MHVGAGPDHAAAGRAAAGAGWLAAGSRSTFGLCRFATENETYILPLFFSLLASRSALVYWQEKHLRTLFWAGLWAVVACLYHQIHFFWWLGLLPGIGFYARQLAVLIYLLPALLVPLVYGTVISTTTDLPFTPAGIARFVFHDFYGGTVTAVPGLKNLLLSVVSLVRSFIQVHGLQLYLFRNNILFALPALLLVAVAGYALWLLFRNRHALRRRVQPHSRPFLRTHLVIFFSQFLFAAYSVGNAEFMVMLPMLLVLLVAARWSFPPLVPVLLGLGLLVWNLSYGSVPAYRFQLGHYPALRALVRQHQEALFVVQDPAQLTNELYYFTGKKQWPNVLPSPSLLALKNRPTDTLRVAMKRVWQQGRPVFTDCLEKPQVVSRASLLTPAQDAAFFCPVPAEAGSCGAYFFRSAAALPGAAQVARNTGSGSARFRYLCPLCLQTLVFAELRHPGCIFAAGFPEYELQSES